MNDGLLYNDRPTHGRARLSRALLTLAIPPLACGFVIGAAAIQSTFPSLKDKAGYSWAFGLYAALNAAFFAFAFVCVPETKGKELEAAGESVRASRTEEIAPDVADASVQA